jgi:regulator of sigma E protease
MIVLQKLLFFIIAIAVLIVIHELGHYLVARWCNVKVLRFSLGFGKPLWMRRFGKDRTEWVVAAVPLGGYVKMVDEREGDVAPEDLPRAFNRQSLGKRFGIVAAGPIANLLLAIVLFWGMFVLGVPDLKPVLGTPVAGSVAEKAGQRSGDIVIAVNGIPVETWQDVRWHVLEHALDREEINLEVRDAEGVQRWRNVPPVAGIGDEPETDIFVRLGLNSFDVPPLLGEIVANSPAAKAGILPGDLVRTVSGEPVHLFSDFIRRISASLGKPLTLGIERQGRMIDIVVTPEAAGSDRPGAGRIGAGVDQRVIKDHQIEVRYGVVESMGRAAQRTWDMSVFILDSMWKMVTMELSLRNISGPVTIADYAGKTAEMGLVPFISFLAMISISLAILNLMPIPLLDGGHLMYYTIEFFKGSPVSERLMDFGQRAGLAMLLALMVCAFYNDINRLLT